MTEQAHIVQLADIWVMRSACSLSVFDTSLDSLLVERVKFNIRGNTVILDCWKCDVNYIRLSTSVYVLFLLALLKA